jgi:CRP-like cAMP-binding protein
MENLNRILPAARAEEIIKIGKTSLLSPEDNFIRAGEIPNKFAFVISGLFRYLYISEKGQEFTKGLIRSGNFISAYSSMITQTPSYFFVEALEKSEVFEIPYRSWLRLLESDPFWTGFLLRFVEKGFIIKEKRERDLLLLDAETRYRNFLEEFPGMEKRIKQTIIASYLGIQPESLSRIRKKVLSDQN